MSIESVRAFLAQHAPDLQVTELAVSSATVPLAAAAYEVVPGQIAKTLTLRLAQEVVLLVMAGDSLVDNCKFKQHFGVKPRLLPADEVERETGHAIGGVGPLGLVRAMRVYCDISLSRFEEVLPAGGAPNAGFRISPARLANLTCAQWVNVGKFRG
jgi:prolyl-tRNA editing enzyme YbaK/EbsC (Cys-tRNA(Pro) deacylase)